MLILVNLTIRYDSYNYRSTQMSEEIEPHILQQYQIIRKIGSGAYGHVWKVMDKQTKQIKALKKNFDAFINSTDAQRTYREIMFLRQLKHPNIINLDKVIRAKNDKDIYLLFEHMEADLHTLIRENGKSLNMEERHKQYIIHQITTAIYFLHSCNLIHRDLKPSNVLINESCQAKLCDFGLVRLIEEPEEQDTVVMTDYIATRWYRAPELLLGCQDYSKEIDIWALGCLIGQLILGKPMFPGTSTINQIQQVVAWTGSPSQLEMKHISANLNPVIVQLLHSRKQINRSQFFGSKASPLFLDLISKMLQFDPSKRLTIVEVLKHEYIAQFYDQKQMREIRNNKLKIQLHINDNKKLPLKQYRQLIYSQVTKKPSRILTTINPNYNTRETTTSHFRSKGKQEECKSIKKQIHKQKSKGKTAAVANHGQSCTTYKNQTVYTSIQGKDENTKPIRKQLRSHLQQSRGDSHKKGISICSKSVNKNTSLSKKKYNDPSIFQTHDISIRDGLRNKTKTNSRSCSEKQDKMKRTITQQSKPCKRVLLSTCYVNDNIGRKVNCKSHIDRL